jgi:hypothetical protein
MKMLCDNAVSVEGTGHSVSSAAAVLDDFISCFSRHNTGYHTLPGVRDFTAVRQYTGMMVRTLLFSLLATLCSIEDLFNEVRQTALIRNMTGQILLMRQLNAPYWIAGTPDAVDALYAFIAANWSESLGDFIDLERVKIHLTWHYRQLYIELGAPVHWSTQHAIEALQRILKAAWRRTSKMNPAEQILRRIATLRYIHGILLPSFGKNAALISALREKRQTQAYFTGSVEAVAGVTTVFTDHPTSAQTAANTRLRKALKVAQIWYADPNDESDEPRAIQLPESHVFTPQRVYGRRAAFFSRQDICEVSVPAYPLGACEGDAKHVIFSVFDDGDDSDDDGVPPESLTDFFLVEGWISYDITGLSDHHPNAIPRDTRLPVKDQNSRWCVDLAVGRKAKVVDIDSAHHVTDLAKERCDVNVSKILRRVKVAPVNSREIIDIARLCQPLLAFPYLRCFDDAKEYFKFRAAASMWDREEWFVCPKLY